jgi:uncharacterized protein YjbI with pentapeptide repeats
LTGATLTHLDLRQANFTDANLAGIRFDSNDMGNVLLIRAKLTGARFTANDLTGADFTDSNGNPQGTANIWNNTTCADGTVRVVACF